MSGAAKVRGPAKNARHGSVKEHDARCFVARMSERFWMRIMLLDEKGEDTKEIHINITDPTLLKEIAWCASRTGEMQAKKETEDHGEEG